MSEHPIKSVIDSVLDGIKSVADVDTIIGKPVEVPGGTVIIPVSKVSLGFALGGADLKGVSTTPEGLNRFGGGSGGGLKIEPVAFLVVSEGDVKILNMNGGMDITEAIPTVVNYVQKFFKKDKE